MSRMLIYLIVVIRGIKIENKTREGAVPCSSGLFFFVFGWKRKGKFKRVRRENEYVSVPFLSSIVISSSTKITREKKKEREIILVVTILSPLFRYPNFFPLSYPYSFPIWIVYPVRNDIYLSLSSILPSILILSSIPRSNKIYLSICVYIYIFV